MKKAIFFLSILLISVFLLVVLFVFALLSTPPAPSSSGWIDNMWNCMDNWMGAGSANSKPYGGIFVVSLVILVGLVVAGVGGVVYYKLFPEIKAADNSARKSFAVQNSPPMDSVLRTLNENEQKVIDVLVRHKGKYLQKYIRGEAGLSRLKTHRVLSRLAEREIVTLKRIGNTNEVHLAEWLESGS